MGGGFYLVTVLQNLVAILTGPVASSIIVIAIVGVGYLWIHEGRINKTHALVVIVGGSVIWGASWLASTLGFTS